MKHLKLFEEWQFQLLERKGNYQLFHKTSKLEEIIKDGYIKADLNATWDVEIRKNVLPNWKKGKYLSISATRNFDYFGTPALELDVEKISDKYKIIPYIENLDYYLDFEGEKLKKASNKNWPLPSKLNKFQRMIRSKSPGAGKLAWRVKTDKTIFDHGIAEEIILTPKLDVGKYVKRIILDKYDKQFNDKKFNKIEKLIKDKYPNIEVIEVDRHLGYVNIKKAIIDKEKESQELKKHQLV